MNNLEKELSQTKVGERGIESENKVLCEDCLIFYAIGKERVQYLIDRYLGICEKCLRLKEVFEI